MAWLIDLYNLKFIHPILREVCLDADRLFGPLCVTGLYRIGDPGVHGQLPLRGLDARCQIKAVGEEIAKEINKRWEYDPDRPEMEVCICHNTGEGLHLHFQVHPNTRRR